jgi:heme exporter protein CcmD
VVEYAASGRFRQPDESAEHGKGDAPGNVAHGTGVLDVQHRRGDDARALRDSGESMKEFFAMGGYAFFVWGAYGVTFALLAFEVFLLMKRKRETKT